MSNKILFVLLFVVAMASGILADTDSVLTRKLSITNDGPSCTKDCECDSGGCDLSGCKEDCECDGGGCNMSNCVEECECDGGNCDMSACVEDCDCEGYDCKSSNCVSDCEGVDLTICMDHCDCDINDGSVACDMPACTKDCRCDGGGCAMPICQNWCKCFGGDCTSSVTTQNYPGAPFDGSIPSWCANVAPERIPYVAECLTHKLPAWCADVPENKRPFVPDCNGPTFSVATAADGKGDTLPSWCENVPPSSIPFTAPCLPADLTPAWCANVPEERLPFVYECSGGGALATFEVNGSGPPEVPDEATCDNACWKKYGNDLLQYYMLASANAADTSAAAEATSFIRVLATVALNLAMFWAYA